MIERHVVFYVGSKVVAAALNLTAVALFTRLAGPAGYGDYLVAFAWAYVVYGWTAQWLPLSFFAHYTPDDENHLVATLYRLMAAILLCLGLAMALACLAGFLEWKLGVKVVALVVALAVYDSAIQIGRAKLSAGRVSLAILLRALLVLIFGALSLSGFHSALALTVAVASAHLLAILPVLPVLRPDLSMPGSQATAKLYAGYGWPLMASFGASSLGQNIDRLLLARQRDTSLVGPYGAVGDLIKQSLVFISEAIAIAYIPLAKTAAAGGDRAGAGAYLAHAFRAYAAVFLFGAVILLTFAEKLIALILGPDFASATGPLIPWFALAAGFSIFRSYYLGQLIYFTGSSRLELLASIATVGLTAGLALLLIPSLGTTGAAFAMAMGQAAACAVFLSGAIADRHSPLPLPWRDFLSIGVWAAGGYALALAIDRYSVGAELSAFLQVIVIGSALWGAARVHNIMNINEILVDFANLAGRVGLIGDGGDGPLPPPGPTQRKDAP